MKKLEYELLPISKIVADENQPRKVFEPGLMKTLRDSIQKFGIKTPINVEKTSDGKYLIWNGERRYRAAKELGITVIPAVIEEFEDEVERLVKQFHVQEQNVEWSPTEKATTVQRLSKKLGLTVPQICELLALPSATGRRYAAFADILDKKEFTRNEIGLDYAPKFVSIRNLVKKLYANNLKEEFTQQQERDLEMAMINRIKDGQIGRTVHLTKIQDSFVKNPKLIEKFIYTKITVQALFLESKAHSAFYLRNGLNNMHYAISNFRQFLANPDIKLDDEQIATLKRAYKFVGDIINKVE